MLDKETTEGRRYVGRNVLATETAQTVYLHGMENEKISRTTSY